jgi:hypothetical protein
MVGLRCGAVLGLVLSTPANLQYTLPALFYSIRPLTCSRSGGIAYFFFVSRPRTTQLTLVHRKGIAESVSGVEDQKPEKGGKGVTFKGEEKD